MSGDHNTPNKKPMGTLEFYSGSWHTEVESGPEGPEPEALVTYATEPSPETRHVGWVWWAQGRMGDAATLSEAKEAAERALLDRSSR